MARVIGVKSKPDKSPTKKRRDVADFKADLAAKKQTEAPTEANASIEFHPIADLFPLLEGDPFDELVNDVRTNGLIHPIIKLDGKILDGRNRHRACLASGVAPVFQNFSGTDPVAYVLSANIHRRHLTNEQRLRLVDEVIKAKPNLSDRQIAKETKVSPTTASKRRKKLESTGQVSTVDTSLGADGKEQPRRKSKSSPALSPSSGEQQSNDIRAKFTAVNGSPRDEDRPNTESTLEPSAPSPRVTGSATTSAVEVAVRLLIDLLAQGTKADPTNVAELLKKKLRPEQIDPLISWLGQLGKAAAVTGAAS
jgi:transposase-like protein